MKINFLKLLLVGFIFNQNAFCSEPLKLKTDMEKKALASKILHQLCLHPMCHICRREIIGIKFSPAIDTFTNVNKGDDVTCGEYYSIADYRAEYALYGAMESLSLASRK
jgi:hypothetical protein